MANPVILGVGALGATAFARLITGQEQNTRGLLFGALFLTISSFLREISTIRKLIDAFVIMYVVVIALNDGVAQLANLNKVIGGK